MTYEDFFQLLNTKAFQEKSLTRLLTGKFKSGTSLQCTNKIKWLKLQAKTCSATWTQMHNINYLVISFTCTINFHPNFYKLQKHRLLTAIILIIKHMSNAFVLDFDINNITIC